jgi:hypothetical protein
MVQDGEWLSLKEAAARLQRSPAALRRAIKNGTLTGRQVDSGRGPVWQVQMPALARRAEEPVTGVVQQMPPTVPPVDHSPVMIELIHLVHDLTSRNEALVYEAAELRATLRLAQERIRQLQAENGSARPQPGEPS